MIHSDKNGFIANIKLEVLFPLTPKSENTMSVAVAPVNTVIHPTVAVPAQRTYAIVLPTWGQPYIWQGDIDKAKKKPDVMLKLLQTIVQGDIAPINTSVIAIHPMFREEKARWSMAERLLRAKGVRVYMNDDETKVSANMAVLVNRDRIATSAPHLFGDIVLLVSATQLASKGIRPEQLTLLGKEGKDGQPEPFEPDDEAEIDAKKAECATNGWDYFEPTGQIYQAIA